MAACVLNASIVTVVGNGPLTLRERHHINSRACVVRMNDMKNMHPGDRVDLRVARYLSHSGRFAGEDLGLGVETWLVDTAPCDEVFSECAYCRSLDCASALYGYSTGTMVISAVHDIETVELIEVFAMNWRGNEALHVDFRYPNVTERCCRKCVVHRTTSRRYDERPALVRFYEFVREGLRAALRYAWASVSWRDAWRPGSEDSM